jgi:hypothetical protein
MADELEDKVIDDLPIIPIIPVDEETPDLPVEDLPVEDLPEDVDRARRMGWIPKESFKGDPAKWRPAKEFLARGEQELPILRERYKKVDTALEKTQAELKAIKNNMDEFVKFTRAAAQRESEARIAELEAAKDDAFDKGDKEAFIEADKALKEIETKKPETPTPTDVPAMTEAEFKTWLTENSWYGKDSDMTDEADLIAEKIKRRTARENGTALVGAPLLEQVVSEIQKRFPEKFTNPNRQRPGAVGSAGGNRTDSPGGKRGKSFSDLPREAQISCNNWVSMGLGTRDEYLKDYDWS